MITEAVLYLATPGDARDAAREVARRPVAFRAVMAAVRSGCVRVGVPAALRTSALERWVARVPAARAAVRWLAPDAPAPTGPVLLVPAAAVLPVAALAALAAAGRGVLAAERDAPVVAAPAPLVAALWADLAAGRAVGDALARALKDAEPAVPGPEWYVRVAGPGGAREAERRLFEALGTPADTRLDRLLHRRLSRPVARLAVACRIGPNAITLASLAVGLGAVWGFLGASPERAAAGLALYALAVVLDHADGEVARLTYAESALGEWLDVAVDTAIHALLVLTLGLVAQHAGGWGFWPGVIAALGVVGSATLTKTSPPAAGGLGTVLGGLANRDGFYAMLLLFIGGLAVQPGVLPWLVTAIAAGCHLFWLAGLAHRGRGAARA